MSVESFVVTHGWRTPARELARVLDIPLDEVARLRALGVVKRIRSLRFQELFRLWNGRNPEERDWPIPHMSYGSSYVWYEPEIALLASLVGTMPVSKIAQVLTNRLRKITGDHKAVRPASDVQQRITKIGLQTGDLQGGYSTAEFARKLGTTTAKVNQLIAAGAIEKFHRVGRRYVIAFTELERYISERTIPPQGYVQLASLKQVLGIKSDKLSEFARMGYIPSAIRCNPLGLGAGIGNTKFGTWYVPKKTAEQLVADRHEGRAMPWHGKPIPENLRSSFSRWSVKQHPKYCADCKLIWGGPAPKTFEEFTRLYPALTMGQKRHLTHTWSDGLTVQDIVREYGCDEQTVRQAVKSGTLQTVRRGAKLFITRSDAVRWKHRGYPTGKSRKSWITLEAAEQIYLFSQAELRSLIKSGELVVRARTPQDMPGHTYVSKAKVAALREKRGFTEKEAAARAEVTLQQLRILLDGVHWRKGSPSRAQLHAHRLEGIPLPTLQAVLKRLKSQVGRTVDEAAADLQVDASWVNARIKEGVVTLNRAPWARHSIGGENESKMRAYLTDVMFERLRHMLDDEAKGALPNDPHQGIDRRDPEWLSMEMAALVAGVSGSLIVKWATLLDSRFGKLLPRYQTKWGWRYAKDDVREFARLYWPTNRMTRLNPPAWLVAEVGVALKTNKRESK